MHSATFLLVAIPVPIFFLGCSTAYLISSCSGFDTCRLYLKTFLACQLSIILFRVVLTIRRSTIGYSSTRGRLPETPVSNPSDKFITPILEELIKLALLALCTTFASGSQNLWSHVILVACIFTLNKLVCNYVTYNPSNYKKRFKSFIRLYNKYLEHIQCNFHKKSISSTSSDSNKSTLVSQSSLDDQDPSAEKPIFQTVSFDSPTKQISPIDFPPNGNMAHHDMIDRLYSVSPKDTLHLSYGDYDCDLEENSLLLANTFKNYQATQVLDPSDNGVANIDDSAEVIEDSPLSSSKRFHTSNLRMSYMWFSWLLPLEESAPPVTQMTKSAIIKKKLSTYTLNSDSSSAKSIRSRKSFGSFDYESQTGIRHKNVANSHTFREFAAFANKYLDFWSPNLAGILRVLDPAFMKFGVPLDKIPTIFFTMHLLSIGIWQYASVLLLAFPFISPTVSYSSWALICPSIAIIKLFLVNYLHCQCTQSYRYSVTIEFLVNVGLAILIGFLYFH